MRNRPGTRRTRAADSSSDRRSRPRRLAFEPLSARLVLSAASLAQVPDHLGSHAPALLADHGALRLGSDAAFGSLGRRPSRQADGPRFGGHGGLAQAPPRPEFGQPSMPVSSGPGERYGNAVPTPRHSSDFGTPPTVTTYVPLQVYFVVVDAPVVPQVVTPLSTTQTTTQSTTPSGGEAIVAVGQSYRSEPDTRSAARGDAANGDTPSRPGVFELASFSASAQATDRASDSVVISAWIATTAVDAYSRAESVPAPTIRLAPEYEVPSDSQSEGGLVELETPSRTGGILSDTKAEDSRQSTRLPGFDVAEALDWLWSEWEAFVEVDAARANEVEDPADNSDTVPTPEVAHTVNVDDSEGGMIELIAGEASIELPQRAYASHDGQPIGESEVRIEAGVALVRVLDVATDTGPEATGDAPPVELPAADEPTADQPDREAGHSAARISAGLLLAVPLSLRRRKDED